MSDRDLPSCIEGPPHLVGKLRYAVEELLRGLGLRPAWAAPAAARLYVGPDPQTAAPAALRFWTGAATSQALLRPAGPPNEPGGLIVDGERWPLPVGPAGVPGADPADTVEADVVGSAFWWLAGWQEAATVARDVHGRFPYELSLQAALERRGGPDAPGGPARPAVDAYRRWLADALRQRGIAVPGRTWGGAPWAVALTHDVDAVRTPRLRALGADLARGLPGRALQRFAGPDSRWASLVALRDLALRRGLRSTFFLKAGAGAPEDVAYRLDDRRLTGFLRALAADGFEVGLHPSYAAHDHPVRLVRERDRLAAVIGERPSAVRSHFLRWTDPLTPRLYERVGFRLDSTLGFADRPGFRRGTAHPFRVWDGPADRPSGLWEAPLAVMDTAVFRRGHGGLEEPEGDIRRVLAGARRAGGCAVLLWHNAVGPETDWQRQYAVLDRILDAAAAEGAQVGPLGALTADVLEGSPALL